MRDSIPARVRRAFLQWVLPAWPTASRRDRGGALTGCLLALGLLLTACAEPVPLFEPGTGPRGEAQLETHLTSVQNLSPAPLAQDEALRVVASTSIVGDVVANVGGEALGLTVLVDRGVDPHAYDTSTQDLRAVERAHVVFVNGFGLEESLLETLENAGGEAPVVSVSEGVEAREFAPGETASTTGLDPHVWFDPALVKVWVGNVANALGSLDPENADSYRANAEAYRAALDELDAWIQASVEAIPEERRLLVTDHDSLGYFADRYGFEVLGAIIPAYSTAAEPSAREVAELQEAIEALDVRAVFVGTTFNPSLGQRLAEDTGIALVPLFTGSLSEADGPAASYLEFMRFNVAAIVEALQ